MNYLEWFEYWLPWLAFVTGFAGSLHCVGMCGPLSMAFLAPGKGGVLKVLSYHLGRIWTYTLLGMLAGLFSSVFYMFGLQRLVALGGGMIVLLALFSNFHFQIPYLSAVQSSLYHYTHKLNKLGQTKWLLLGMVNGIIPCGLVYIALAASITSGSIFTGGLYMLAFGLGTFPLFILNLLPGVFSFHIKPIWQRRLIPMLSIVAAIIFFMRGAPNLSANQSATAKEACHTPFSLKRDKSADVLCLPASHDHKD